MLRLLLDLKTPESEINSRLGMHIKREILMKLSEPQFREQNPNIAAKYAQFIIPVSCYGYLKSLSHILGLLLRIFLSHLRH